MDPLDLAFKEIELIKTWLHMSTRKRQSLLVGLLIILIGIVLPLKRKVIRCRVALAQGVEDWSEPRLLSTNASSRFNGYGYGRDRDYDYGVRWLCLPQGDNLA